MNFCFSKMFGENELMIKIKKPYSGDEVSIVANRDTFVLKSLNGKASEYEKRICKYNISMHGNEREPFDSLFPKEFEDLSRVVGITNSLGHYFTFFLNRELSIQCFGEYINNVKGFVFVDWDVVNGRRLGSQLLYSTNESDNNEGNAELIKNYLSGRISKITYEIAGNCGLMYCMESAFLNKSRTVFTNKIRNKINRILKKRFPG